MLPEDSPLVRVPVILDRRQRRFLAGLRYASEMVEVAYGRLQDGARLLFDPRHQLLDDTSARRTRTGMFLDAWCIIDNANRFGRLLAFLPGYNGTAGMFADFLERTKAVWDVRNVQAHLDREFKKPDVALTPSYPFGTLSWIDYRAWDAGSERGVVHACRMTAGPRVTKTDVKTYEETMIDPRLRPPAVDHFRLWIFAHVVDLTSVAADLDRTAGVLSAAVVKGHRELVTRLEAERGQRDPQWDATLKPDLVQSMANRVVFQRPPAADTSSAELSP